MAVLFHSRIILCKTCSKQKTDLSSYVDDILSANAHRQIRLEKMLYEECACRKDAEPNAHIKYIHAVSRQTLCMRFACPNAVGAKENAQVALNH